jgi:indole-3-glycerol phosphate synthase
MILDTIAAAARRRVAEQKTVITPEEMRRRAEERTTLARSVTPLREGNFETSILPLERALKKPGISFICEVKKASPSKGVIAETFPYLDIACDYERAGADAISVLTEPEYFLGSGDYLTGIRRCVRVPLLRKDFIIDPYQLYESKAIGADALLLICALLDTDTIADYLQICGNLELSALVEAHNETEVKSALSAGARIIGVNNRDLKTFQVDLENSIRLRPIVPENVLFVAESGIKTAEDIDILRGAGVDAVLIGETLMRSDDKKAALEELRAGVVT